MAVPKTMGDAKTNTPVATAGVTGGIAMLETHPKSTKLLTKFIIIEGNGFVSLKSAIVPSPRTPESTAISTRPSNSPTENIAGRCPMTTFSPKVP